jgi:predicted DNA-binding protein (UPF0251 family)
MSSARARPEMVRLDKLDATQRATAKALGVTHTTVQNDLGNKLPKASQFLLAPARELRPDCKSGIFLVCSD